MSIIKRIFGGQPEPQAQPAVDVEALVSNARKEGASIALAEVMRAQQNAPWPSQIGNVRAVFGLNNPWSYAVSQAPGVRPGTLASPLMLRQIADVWDPARACIEHLKREVRRVPFSIVSKDKDRNSTRVENQIKEFNRFMSVGGGVGGSGNSYRNFEQKWLEDVLVTGCLSIYCDYVGTLSEGVGHGIFE